MDKMYNEMAEKLEWMDVDFAAWYMLGKYIDKKRKEISEMKPACDKDKLILHLMTEHLRSADSVHDIMNIELWG